MPWIVCVLETEDSDDSDWLQTDRNRQEKNRREKRSRKTSDMRAFVRAVGKLRDIDAELRGTWPH